MGKGMVKPLQLNDAGLLKKLRTIAKESLRGGCYRAETDDGQEVAA